MRHVLTLVVTHALAFLGGFITGCATWSFANEYARRHRNAVKQPVPWR